MHTLAVTTTRPNDPPDLHSAANTASGGNASWSSSGVSADSAQADALAAAKGDREAFHRLYQSQCQRVFSLVARMVADRQLAEELVQDVFVRAWQKLPTFRGDAAFSTWLHRLAVNVVLSQRKSDSIKQGRRGSDIMLDLAAARATPVGERIDLEQAIALLPSGARQVFVLHDVEGFTHEEIGTQLGITSGGSKAQLHRARQLLREALNR